MYRFKRCKQITIVSRFFVFFFNKFVFILIKLIIVIMLIGENNVLILHHKFLFSSVKTNDRHAEHRTEHLYMHRN